MMVEGGKIDWAGHANDAASGIHDTNAFSDAVEEAIKFYNNHSDETLILVTGDHETGAVMDVAVDITSAVAEVVEKRPDITKAEAVKSGINVGRSIMETMMTTLLLAYSGGYIGLLMVFAAQGIPIINILNLKYVSSEILHTLIGSFGLVTVAPFTAIASGILLPRKNK